ncbi:TetR/AcrR family transcriptional regulator [Nonomuraea sp. NPDC050383]|uniref:TetR/AcrR family transcriptional regulator n=1 Tax=Nonomuraea sp. NPDC050383 TaxID=3364362 RepID=UPI003796B216
MKTTSERLAEVAHDILVREGPEAVTMRRVADAAGVTAMAIYKHYPNRQALLGVVVDRAFRSLETGWGLRGAGGDWESRLFGLLEDFLDFALGTPHLYTYLMTERREHARRFPDDFTGGRSPAFTHLVALVEEAMRAGRLRDDDPLEVTLALTSGVQGLVQLHLGGRVGLPEEEFRALCRRTVRRVLDGVKA